MQPEIGGPNFEFLAKLEEALKAAGFENVFVDRIAVEAGDHYESLIYRAIADCDLFVAVIGRNWLDILRAKTAAGEHDILAREIRAALDQEKLIVPLLIDGAIMPRLADLPEQIRYFHYSNGVPVKSSDGVEVITAKLKDRSRKVAQMRRQIRGGSGPTLFLHSSRTTCAQISRILSASGSLDFSRGTAWPKRGAVSTFGRFSFCHSPS